MTKEYPLKITISLDDQEITSGIFLQLKIGKEYASMRLWQKETGYTITNEGLQRFLGKIKTIIENEKRNRPA